VGLTETDTARGQTHAFRVAKTGVAERAKTDTARGQTHAARVTKIDLAERAKATAAAKATISKAMRTMNPVHESTTCSVAACAEIIGAKWTALLVHDLSEGPRRFSELEHSCAGISPRTLSERLRALEAEGILERHSYPESPPRVEYQLTAKGEGLLPIIDAMREFGRDWGLCTHT
jgi:DNA-binding HxlR family transcriptional regulator